MNARYEMVKFDAESYPGTAIVRLQATALDGGGQAVTFRKRTIAKVDGKPTVAYEQAPVFAETERRLAYDGKQDPAKFGLEAAKALKGELDDRLAKALAAHGVVPASEPSRKIDGPVELKL